MNRTVYESPFRMVRMFAAQNVGDSSIAHQIISFQRLPAGWHYGEGRGATEQATESALQAHALLEQYKPGAIEVFPDVDGGVLVSGYHANEVLEVFCGPNGEFDVVHEDEGAVVHEEKDVSLRKIICYLRGLPWASTKLSDFFIPSISAGKDNDLLVLHSETPPTMEAFQSSIQSVLDSAVDRNVSTWHASISQVYPETLPYFGGLTPQNCLTELG